MKQQTLLKEKKEEINERLVHFTLYNTLNQNIHSQSYNLNDDKFIQVLEQINTSMAYLSEHVSNNHLYRTVEHHKNVITARI